MKKKKKHIKYYLKKCAAGTISLFLIILLTPFVSIASILIEAQHYNSSVALLDEAMGVSAVSLLAEYDKYLKDRWGFVAASQQADMKELFADYLKTNKNVLGSTLSINDTDVNGLYPLTDDELFKNQLLQYSKYNVSTKVVEDTVEGVLDLAGITKKLESLKSIDNILKLVTNGEKTADSMISLYDSQKEFQESADKLQNAIDACNKKYNDGNGSFESRMNKLTEELKKEEPKNLDTLENNYNSAKNDYAGKINGVVSALEDYKTKSSALSSSYNTVKNNLKSTADSVITVTDDTIKNLQKDYDDAKERVKNYPGDKDSDEYKNLVAARDKADSDLADAKVNQKIETSAKNGINSLDKSYSDMLDKCSAGHIDAEIIRLNGLAESLPSASDIDEDSTASGYSPGSIAYATKDDIKDFIEQQEKEMEDASFSAFVKGIISTMDSLVKCSTVYEGALCAVVETESVAESPASAAIKGIADAVKGMSDFKEAKSLKAYWEAIKKICKGISDAVININKFSAEMIINIPGNVLNLFTTDRLWYISYCYYMLTCRTDYSKSTFKTGGPAMTALSAKPDLPTTETVNNIYKIGEATSLLDTFKKIAMLGESDAGTSDTTFYGAEMEYLICGSQAELANQVCVFMMTYLMRLIIDAPAVIINDEVEMMATSAAAATLGIGEIVVYALEIFLEPLVDTLILVNGGKVQLFETTIYLTPSGILDLVTTVMPGIVFSNAEKEEIQNNLKSAFKKSGSDGKVSLSKEPETPAKPNTGFKASDYIPKIDYRQQCLILMIVFVKNDDIINRLQSMVQMETKYHYETNMADFSLDKSYTFVETSADVKIKQIAPTLTDSSIFEVKRKIYRGY